MDEILEMKLIPLTEREVINTVTPLAMKNASWYDGISNKILKHCENHISEPFTYVFILH